MISVAVTLPVSRPSDGDVAREDAASTRAPASRRRSGAAGMSMGRVACRGSRGPPRRTDRPDDHGAAEHARDGTSAGGNAGHAGHRFMRSRMAARAGRRGRAATRDGASAMRDRHRDRSTETATVRKLDRGGGRARSDWCVMRTPFERTNGRYSSSRRLGFGRLRHFSYNCVCRVSSDTGTPLTKTCVTSRADLERIAAADDQVRDLARLDGADERVEAERSARVDGDGSQRHVARQAEADRGADLVGQVARVRRVVRRERELPRPPCAAPPAPPSSRRRGRPRRRAAPASGRRSRRTFFSASSAATFHASSAADAAPSSACACRRRT